jgi:hypothetical protein
VRVLLVDDSADARELFTTVLRRCGAEVRPAASAAEALELLAEWRPDVLVSDIAMPEEDGCFLIRRVQSRMPREETPIPAPALTAYARVEERLRALSAGYQMHLAKPIEPEELAAAIAALASGDVR